MSVFWTTFFPRWKSPARWVTRDHNLHFDEISRRPVNTGSLTSSCCPKSRAEPGRRFTALAIRDLLHPRVRLAARLLMNKSQQSKKCTALDSSLRLKCRRNYGNGKCKLISAELRFSEIGFLFIVSSEMIPRRVSVPGGCCCLGGDFYLISIWTNPKMDWTFISPWFTSINPGETERFQSQPSTLWNFLPQYSCCSSSLPAYKTSKPTYSMLLVICDRLCHTFSLRSIFILNLLLLFFSVFFIIKCNNMIVSFCHRKDLRKQTSQTWRSSVKLSSPAPDQPASHVLWSQQTLCIM